MVRQADNSGSSQPEYVCALQSEDFDTCRYDKMMQMMVMIVMKVTTTTTTMMIRPYRSRPQPHPGAVNARENEKPCLHVVVLSVVPRVCCKLATTMKMMMMAMMTTMMVI